MSQIGSALDSNYNTAISNAISESTGGSEMDKQAFLTLLVTQFKYQDPLNPMEDKEFVAQLAQFSALEQSMNINTNLETLMAIQQQQTAISSANYIGKEVSARGYGVSVTNGDASLVEYAAAEPMSKCYVNILDAGTSTVVATVQLGERATGIHKFEWDGKFNDGRTAPDGVYSVAFVGYNTNGERVMVDTSVSGKVNGVSHYNGEQYLSLDDGRTVLMSAVREIHEVASGSGGNGTGSGAESENAKVLAGELKRLNDTVDEGRGYVKKLEDDGINVWDKVKSFFQ